MERTNAATQLSEVASDFYNDSLCAHADTAYRLALTILLSNEAAWKCVDQTYTYFAQNPEATSQSHDPELLLISEIWKQIQSDNYSETDPKLPIFRILKSLERHERLALAAVDLVGVAVEELAAVTGRNESEIRTSLAKARQTLISSDLEA